MIPIFNFQSVFTSFIGGILIGGISTYKLTDSYLTIKYLNKENKTNLEMFEVLKKSNDKLAEIEKINNNLTKEMENKNVENKKKINDLYIINRNLSKQYGGLRDPGRTISGVGDQLSAASNTAEYTKNTAYERRLSNEASEFLLEYGKNADEVAEYANICHEWVKKQFP